MKYIIVLSDGMADEPIGELQGKTPLEKADTPNMDKLAKVSEIGLAQNSTYNPGWDGAGK